MNSVVRQSLPIDTADARACTALIAGLPLTNAPEAHRLLTTLLTGLSHRPPAAAAYLDVLETARASLAFLQDEIAQRYAAKPLPPAPAEGEAFRQVLSLWQAMARAYAQVAQMGSSDPLVQDRLALICQRCVHYAGKVILEFYRARREPSPGAWIDLHGYYATAEEWDIDKIAVAEPLNEGSKTQCAADAYAAVLLVDLASPYSRSAHEFAWICRWAQRFAPLTAVMPLGEPVEARAFGIDLMHDASTRPLQMLPHKESVRWFDTRKLSAALQELLARLKAHESPAALGLGNDCPAPIANRLLLQLYKPWCLNATPRRFQRRGASGLAQVCLQARLFFVAKGHAFVLVVRQRAQHKGALLADGQHAVLLCAHGHASTRVGVQHAARLGPRLVHGAVDHEACRVYGEGRLMQFGALHVHLDQARRRDLVEHQAVRVDEEMVLARARD